MKRALLVGAVVGLGMLFWHQLPEIRRYIKIEMM
jgi:hypothetical protein